MDQCSAGPPNPNMYPDSIWMRFFHWGTLSSHLKKVTNGYYKKNLAQNFDLVELLSIRSFGPIERISSSTTANMFNAFLEPGAGIRCEWRWNDACAKLMVSFLMDFILLTVFFSQNKLLTKSEGMPTSGELLFCR